MAMNQQQTHIKMLWSPCMPQIGDHEHKKWSQFEEDMQYLKQGGYKQEKEEHKEYEAREPR